MAEASAHVREGSDSEIAASLRHVRFSNRPIGVKRFQTIPQHSVDVARGLALLFGIGTRALPSWDSRTRRNNLYRGLAVLRTAGPSGHANSPQPSSRKGHHSTVRWSSSVLLSCLICVALRHAKIPLLSRPSGRSSQQLLAARIAASLRCSRATGFPPASEGIVESWGRLGNHNRAVTVRLTS